MKERLVVLCVAALLGAAIGLAAGNLNSGVGQPSWEKPSGIVISTDTLWEIREIAKELP